MTIADKLPQDWITEGQPLVRSLALKISRSIPFRVDLDDLIAYGQLGLAEAAQDYDPTHGTQFTTFAYYRVRGAIYDGISKMSWTSRARYNRMRYEQMANEVLRAEDASSPATGRASLQQDARWLGGITERLAVVYLTTHGQEGNLDQVEDSAAQPLAVVARREVSQKLHELIEALPPDERRLIRATYFEGATLQEAAQKLGISKSWASRLHARTLEKLARALRQLGVSE